MAVSAKPGNTRSAISIQEWFRTMPLPFGQYSGTPLKDIPSGYLSYLLDGDSRRSARLQTALEQEWAYRRKHSIP